MRRLRPTTPRPSLLRGLVLAALAALLAVGSAAVGLPELGRAITYGASPRASVNLILGAKALAIVRGREFALPEDVRDLAPEVLRHRILLSYEGLAEEVRLEELVARLVNAVPLPRVHLGDPHGTSSPGVTRDEPA